MINQWKVWAMAVGLVLHLAVGFFIGKSVYKPVSEEQKIVNQEKVIPEAIHEDGSITIKRIASNKPPKMERSTIPGEVKRIQEIVLNPVDADPINLEIVQSEDKEGIHTTIKADGAEVIGSLDSVIPQKTMQEKNLHWNAQILSRWNDRGREWGILGAWESERIIASVGLFPANKEVMAGIGWRW